MKCRQFQNQVYEYVEGSLSAGEQAAADEHLALCNACLQTVRREQQCAQFLFNHFRQDTETLALRPEIRRRILTTSQSDPATGVIMDLWNRFRWPLGIAASVLVIAALCARHLSTLHFNASQTQSAIFVEVSYHAPIYTFRKEGNLILDTVSEETVVASETLLITKPIPGKQERKMPL